MSRTTLGLLTAVAALGLATSAQAQTCGDTGATATCNINTTVSTTVQNIVYMATPTTFALTAPTGSTFGALTTGTVTEGSNQAITVNTNTTWILKVSAAAANWTVTAGGNTSKLAGDLSWTSNAGTNWHAISSTGVQAEGTTGVAGTSTVNIGYKTAWNLLTDTPATYSLVVTYTISAP